MSELLIIYLSLFFIYIYYFSSYINHSLLIISNLKCMISVMLIYFFSMLLKRIVFIDIIKINNLECVLFIHDDQFCNLGVIYKHILFKNKLNQV